MFLKISPDLDMPLTSLDTKNYCPRLNGLGDIAIIANPIFLGHLVEFEFNRVNFGESEMLVNRNYASLVNWNSIVQLIYRVDSNKTHVSL